MSPLSSLFRLSTHLARRREKEAGLKSEEAERLGFLPLYIGCVGSVCRNSNNSIPVGNVIGLNLYRRD
jgi:hypothetical protein